MTATRRRDSGKCSRCHKNPVTRPARICQPCIKAPKKRRTNRATSRPYSFRASGGAAGVLARSTPSWPSANGSYYNDQPDSCAGGEQ